MRAGLHSIARIHSHYHHQHRLDIRRSFTILLKLTFRRRFRSIRSQRRTSNSWSSAAKSSVHVHRKQPCQISKRKASAFLQWFFIKDPRRRGDEEILEIEKTKTKSTFFATFDRLLRREGREA